MIWGYPYFRKPPYLYPQRRGLMQNYAILCKLLNSTTLSILGNGLSKKMAAHKLIYHYMYVYIYIDRWIDR